MRATIPVSTLLVVLMLTAPMLVHATSDPLVALAGHVAPFVADARDLGAADAGAPLRLVVALRLIDEPGMLAIADARPFVPLTHDQLLERFAAPRPVVDGMVSWLSTRGIHVDAVSDDGTLLGATTTVGVAAAAFGAAIRDLEYGDRVVRSNVEEPRVPASLAPWVQAVIGLSDARFETLHQAVALDTLGTPLAGDPPYTPADLRNAYDMNSVIAEGYDGLGRHAAITSWGRPFQNSLDEYSSTYGLPQTTIVYHDSSGGSSCTGGDTREWDMDIQLEHALAPRATLHAYCGASATTSDMIEIIGRVVTENVADVISQSWGLCEALIPSSTAFAYETKFAQAAAQGQAFFTSSGDGGSRECTRSGQNTKSPSFPATAPHSTSVGGTRLDMTGASYAGETTWNTCAPCGGAWVATGGGYSQYFAKPAWQTAPAGQANRASPDWSAVGDPETGVRVRSGGSWYQIGGTSASSPLTAGLWATMLTKNGRFGHAAAAIWPIATGPNGFLAFRDITTGHNGDYQAGVGYDYPTGHGTPVGHGLLDFLVNSFPPPRGLVATGGDGKVALSWLPPEDAADVTSYRIYRNASNGIRILLAQVALNTTFTDWNVTDGATYIYNVTSRNATFESLPTPAVSAAAFGAPRSAPTSPAVSPGAASLLVSWGAPASDGGSAITGYRVYADDALLAAVGPTGSHAERGLAPSATRAYRVSAVNVYGEGPRSAAVIGTTLASADAPTNLRAATGQREVTLTWDAPTGGAAGYRIHRGASPGALAPLLDVGAATTHTDAALAAGATWHYAVSALGASESAASNTASATTLRAPTAAPPSVVALTGPGVGEILVRWVPPAQTEASAIAEYRVYRCDAGDELLTTLSGRSHLDAALGANQTRCFKVAASNAEGEGTRSGPVTATTFAPPGAPLGVASTPGDGSVGLAWSPPAWTGGRPIVGYRVYAATTSGGALDLVGSPASPSFTHAGLAEGDIRYYRVSTVTDAGEGPLAEETLGRALTRVLAPTNLAAAARTGTLSTALTWAAPANAATSIVDHYRVYRALSPGASIFIATVAAPRTQYVDPTCLVGQTCYYKVSAVAALGEGPRSNEASRPGATLGVTNGGLPSTSPSSPARLMGHEITVLQMDVDDRDFPRAGSTRDRSLAQGHAEVTGFTTSAGRFGAGYSLKTNGHHIALRDALTTQMKQGTLMLWVKPDSITEGHGQLVMKRAPELSTFPTELAVTLGTDGSVAFSTSEIFGSTTLETMGGAVPIGAWTHVAVSWGPEGKRIFVNGALAASNTDNTEVSFSSTATEIGIDPSRHSQTGLRGTLDEFRLYDVPLGIGEVQDIMARPYAAGALA